jgi:predicted alpha/beta hydrolase family esterase
MKDIAAQTPEIPHSWKPDYPLWQKEFERYDITLETTLVGHSCGGGFIVRWLSEHRDVKVGKVVLVAPWLDPDRNETTDFFDFTVDPKLAERTQGLTLFNSDNDYPSIHESVKMIRDTVPGTTYREFHNYGHFATKTSRQTSSQSYWKRSGAITNAIHQFGKPAQTSCVEGRGSGQPHAPVDKLIDYSSLNPERLFHGLDRMTDRDPHINRVTHCVQFFLVSRAGGLSTVSLNNRQRYILQGHSRQGHQEIIDQPQVLKRLSHPLL